MSTTRMFACGAALLLALAGCKQKHDPIKPTVADAGISLAGI
jgi:hypothetical protein